MTIQIVRISKSATLPTRAHDSDAGYDLYASLETVIPAQNRGLVKKAEKIGYRQNLLWVHALLMLRPGHSLTWC